MMLTTKRNQRIKKLIVKMYEKSTKKKVPWMLLYLKLEPNQYIGMVNIIGHY